MASEASERVCGCKLGRVAERRDIQSVLDHLETVRREQDGSLRQLAAEFNRRVLAHALEANGHVPLQGEAANLYRLLTADDVSGGMRTQARHRLQDHGVDVESLEADFVSYQTVNRHLKGCLGHPGTDSAETISVTDAEDRLYALRNRTEAVTDETIGQLAGADVIDIGTFEVAVDIGVTCTDCGSQLAIAELFSRKECQCTST